MSVFDVLDYRDFLKNRVNELKQFDPNLSFARMAEAMMVQRSYLSLVIAKKTHLNADQLYLAGQFLSLERNEVDYLLLLLEEERCQIPARKKLMEKQREKLRAAKHSAARALERKSIDPQAGSHWVEYYGNSDHSIVHQLLGIKQYRQNPSSIAKRMGMEEEMLARTFRVLEKCGIVETKDGKLSLLQENVHLDHKSYLSRMHASAFRARAARSQERNADPKDYFFTATFSSSHRTREEIHQKFLEFLEWLSPKVSDSPSEEVFHLNFDLFKP